MKRTYTHQSTRAHTHTILSLLITMFYLLHLENAMVTRHNLRLAVIFAKGPRQVSRWRACLALSTAVDLSGAIMSAEFLSRALPHSTSHYPTLDSSSPVRSPRLSACTDNWYHCHSGNPRRHYCWVLPSPVRSLCDLHLYHHQLAFLWTTREYKHG